MKLNRSLLLAWTAWLIFYPAAAVTAQNESGRGSGGQVGLGLVLGLVLIGLAIVLARRKNQD